MTLLTIESMKSFILAYFRQDFSPIHIPEKPDKFPHKWAILCLKFFTCNFGTIAHYNGIILIFQLTLYNAHINKSLHTN